MSRSLPENPFLMGGYAPWPMEGEICDLIVEGEIPAELSGALYRNGPNPQFAPRGNYHWFDGDGMIHAFFFRDGKVDYKNRWVRTGRFEQERAAGEALFAGLASPGSGDPRVDGKSSNAANTSIVWHAGKLLALWEGGLPHELDPHTLETVGPYDFDGRLTREMDREAAAEFGFAPDEGKPPGIMTAHPKIDPRTGEMLFFGYSPTPPYLVYYVTSADGELVRSVEINAPFASMVHDFIITDEHVIFPVFPAVFDPEAMEKTGLALSWQPERGTHIGIMPRDGGSEDLVWLQTDPCYVFHPMNARTEGSRIIAEVARYPVVPFFGVDDGAGPAVLTRWVMDLESGTVKEEPLDEDPSEFPKIDERYAGRAYRHGYCVGVIGGGEASEPQNADEFTGALFHYDLEKRVRREHRLAPADSSGEPIFVPRCADAPEGDGYLLAVIYRGEKRRSDLLVLDAQNIDAPPLATVRLPHRIPAGFHGCWRPET